MNWIQIIVMLRFPDTFGVILGAGMTQIRLARTDFERPTNDVISRGAKTPSHFDWTRFDYFDPLCCIRYPNAVSSS